MEPPQWSVPSLTAADPPRKGEWGSTGRPPQAGGGLPDALLPILSAHSESGSEASYEAVPRRNSTDGADSRKAKSRYR